jgi:acyl-CoA hydrolase
MAAERHCRTEVVTAGIDSMSFKEPVRIGDHVVLQASVNYVSRSSMEVGVRVTREDPTTGEKAIATTAHVTMVALDEDKRPTAAPPVVPETAEEKRRYENAKQRVQDRKERRQASER